MKGKAHSSPFAALSFPNLKKVSVYCLIDRESFSRRHMVKPSLELVLYGNFLHITEPQVLGVSNFCVLGHPDHDP